MPTTELPSWFAAANDALHAGDPGPFVAMYADDAVHEFPFAPEGSPRRLEGRAAIAEHMARIHEQARFESFVVTSSHEAGDELIIEATARGRQLPSGLPFRRDYVWFVTHRDGQVTRFRDYMNPHPVP